MKTRKILSLVLVLGLCLGLLPMTALAAEGANYFEKKGIPLVEKMPMGEGESLEVQYAAWNKADRNIYTNDYGWFWVEDYAVTPAEKPGYKTVTLTVKFGGRATVIDDVEYFTLTWSNDIYDYYTGRNFDRPSLWDGDEASDEYTVIYNESIWPITYSVSVDWEFGPWYDDGYRVQPGFCTQVNTFVVPEDYDGLVYALYDTAKPYGGEEYTPTVSYAEKEEGVQYFRFGQENPNKTEEPQSGYLTQQGVNVLLTECGLTDVGVAYWMELTNTTDQPIQGAYGILFYDPDLIYEYTFHGNTETLLRAQFMFFDLDLAPGETVKIQRNSQWWGLTESSAMWLAFDSPEERESFVDSSPILRNGREDLGNGYDYFDMHTEEGLKFLKDTFGLTPAD